MENTTVVGPGDVWSVLQPGLQVREEERGGAVAGTSPQLRASYCSLQLILPGRSEQLPISSVRCTDGTG